MGDYVTFGKHSVTKEEYFAPGHRACLGCGEALAVRLACKALGQKTIIVTPAMCLVAFSSLLPYTSWRVPWMQALFENTAAVASGVESGLNAITRKGRRPADKIAVVGMAGEGGTVDIGIQALSGALERGHDFLYICFDNEAYMNTGIQRSSATPFGAATTTSPPGSRSMGQVTRKKNMPAIVAAHDIPYVATACHSYPFDLMAKVAKGATIKGPAYVQILSVCPTGWGCASNLAIKIGRLAVQTRMFPLYEIENGQYKLGSGGARPRPVSEYLKLQGRFRHLSEETIKEIQRRVDEEYAELEEAANQVSG